MRWSTLKAWWDLLRHGKKRRDSEDFFMVSPRRITFEQPLASEAKNSKPTPVESPVSAFFPGHGPDSSASDRRYSDSLGGESLQRRMDSDASEHYPGRPSMFIEHPDEFVENQSRGKQPIESPPKAEKQPLGRVEPREKGL